MKPFTRIIPFSLIAASLVVFVGCDITADSEKEWGFPVIYMPQATIQNGDANNNYVVPWPESPESRNEFNRNYTIDNSNGGNNLNVLLGVYRAGLQDLEAYTVDVVARPDTTSQLITDGVFDNAMLLPADAYTLPPNVSVENGEREATFLLSIDRSKLLNDYPSYTGQRLVLAVGIANPSRYELNRSISTTIVIVEEGWDTLTED